MRIAILNVKYSANLGDGLLSECLEAELATIPQVSQVRSIDLAARTEYGSTGSHRRLMLAVLEKLPAGIRRLSTGFALRRFASRRLAPLCRQNLQDADVVILGGGNLLADADLNFPIKVHCGLVETAVARRPASVFGVGVSDNWSPAGARLFGKALAQVNLVHAVVRDTRSQSIWNRNLSSFGVMPASLCRDPGLLTGRHFSAAPRPSGEPRIGLGLTDPLALRYHGAASAGRALDDWLVLLARTLAGKGYQIALFTNGSAEDRAYLDRMAPRILAACDGKATVSSAFARPADLAYFVSGCAAVIAHRMHACIAAYAYAVPAIGLAWDEKLNSFFESVGRGEYMIDPAAISARIAADLAIEAIECGIDPAIHQQVVEEASHDVRRLQSALSTAMAAAGA